MNFILALLFYNIHFKQGRLKKPLVKGFAIPSWLYQQFKNNKLVFPEKKWNGKC